MSDNASISFEPPAQSNSETQSSTSDNRTSVKDELTRLREQERRNMYDTSSLDSGEPRSKLKRFASWLNRITTGYEGSPVWVVRRLIEWVHEFVQAVNSSLAARRAEKLVSKLDNDADDS